MGPTRFPNGVGYGFVNNFNYRGTTAGNVSGSATPNVTDGELFYANNTGSLTITNFILSDTANRMANYEGKVIRLFVLDTATQIDNSGSLFLVGTHNLRVGAAASGAAFIELMHSRGNWYEINRSMPNRSEVSQVTMTVASSYNVDGISVMGLNNTGSVVRPVSAFSGGHVGQTVNVYQVGSNGIRFVENSNFLLVGTSTFIANASALYQFTKVTGSQWRLLTTNTLGV